MLSEDKPTPTLTLHEGDVATLAAAQRNPFLIQVFPFWIITQYNVYRDRDIDRKTFKVSLKIMEYKLRDSIFLILRTGSQLQQSLAWLDLFLDHLGGQHCAGPFFLAEV